MLRIGWLALFAVMLSGCGGGGDGTAPQPTPPPPPPIGLTITCTPLELITSETSQCTASVEGTGEAPEWEVTSGTIDSGTGLFTAPDSPGTVTITATVRDSGRSASDSVEITIRQRPLTVSGNPNPRDSRTGRTPLHAAAMANAPKLIAALAAAGADVEARDKDGLTALHAAAALNSVAAIAALLDAGADFHAQNLDGQTPLQYAVNATSADTAAAIAALSEAGADPNVRDEYGWTPLHRAAWNAGNGYSGPGSMATLAALVEAGADPNARDVGGGTPLYWAAGAYSPAVGAEVIATLLDAGADPNARNNYGHTPLWFWVASSKNSPAIMAALLEAGADLNTRDDDGNTLLHLAAERDRPVVIVALLDTGADPNARNNDGRTPLHAAACSTAPGRPVTAAAAIVVLLEAGADPNARDDTGYTALQLAPADSISLMTTLLEAHAGRIVRDLNARADWFGYTALHAAARANNLELIAALIEAGADVDAIDNDGHTPLLLAAGARRGRGAKVPPPTYHPEAIAALAAAGADLETRDRYGQTALLLATNLGDTAMIAMLLEAGADLEVRDELNGWTAWQRALEQGNTAMIAALTEAWADVESGDYNDFTAVLALAAGNPAALVEAEVDPNAHDDNGRTVLHWATKWDDSAALAALAALLEAGADLNSRDKYGHTALHWAAQRRNMTMIAALAEAGADVSVRDNTGGTALHAAVRQGSSATIAALLEAGADLEERDANDWTALQLAAYLGVPVAIAALVEAGADLEARDHGGRTALQLAASRDYQVAPVAGGFSTSAAIAALLEVGADLSSRDNSGLTPLHSAATAGNQAATGMLLALGANWISDPDPGADVNARIVDVELFQGPMVWQWTAARLGMHDERTADHAKALLHRAATVAVRIGSETPDPMPELSVSLSDADGRSWAVEADPVQDPIIVSVPSNSESGLWETEYVYELPADWVDSGHRASFAIDPYNRLEETDENDNTATLTMDGYAVPVFDVTFVPIVFSGAPPDIDTDTYMGVIGDLVPIGEYRAQVGRPLDLSGRNLGLFDQELSELTALGELLHRWNAEAGENENYYGLLSTTEIGVGFGGRAYSPGHVAVSGAIGGSCQAEREFCGRGAHAHELGHNLGLAHAPGGCNETEPIDHDYPYAGAGIGPRRGWVTTRNEFVSSGDAKRYRDLMAYCTPRFVSDYNYNKMVDHRLSFIAAPPDDSGRLGPSLEIGPIPSVALSMTTRAAPSVALSVTPLAGPFLAQATPPGAAAPSDASGPSLAVTGAVDEFGLWSISQIDTSTQPPRPPSAGGEYFFVLQDAYHREIYREPMALLTPTHGETRRAWAVRVPVPEHPPAFLAILDARGPLFIEPISLPPSGGE